MTTGWAQLGPRPRTVTVPLISMPSVEQVAGAARPPPSLKRRGSFVG